jgi:hypothetical protein
MRDGSAPPPHRTRACSLGSTVRGVDVGDRRRVQARRGAARRPATHRRQCASSTSPRSGGGCGCWRAGTSTTNPNDAHSVVVAPGGAPRERDRSRPTQESTDMTTGVWSDPAPPNTKSTRRRARVHRRRPRRANTIDACRSGEGEECVGTEVEFLTGD